MVATRRQAKEKKPALSNMPDNILVEIYKHLPLHQRIQSESVCRRFRNVLKDHAFSDITKLEYRPMLMWKKSERLRGKPRRHIGKGSIQRLFARCGRYLTEVHVGSFPERLQSPVLELILLPTCPRIKKLRLSFQYTRLDDSDLLKIGRALPNLSELDLSSYATGCTESAIAEFLQGQTCLRVVNLCWFYAAPTAIKYLPSVEVLNIARCHQISQEDVFRLKDCCPNLKDLDISSIDNLMEHDLKFDGWTRLEILRFNSLYMLHWRTADINSITFKDMPALKECHMQSNKAVNDQTLRTLCYAAPNLVELDLYTCGGYFESRLSNSSLTHISRLRRLERLNAGGMSELTEQQLISIAGNGRLKHLDLVKCGRIGNSAVQAVLDSCKELTFLNVSFTLIDLAVVPFILTYADEFEERRSILCVVSEYRNVQDALNSHPKIKCTPDHRCVLTLL